MTKKLKITLITVLLFLASCMGVTTVFAKYTVTKPVGNGFSLSITLSFSGEVASNDDLKFAKSAAWGKDYTVYEGKETYTDVISAKGVDVTVEGAKMRITSTNVFSVSDGGTLTINNAEETSVPGRGAIASVSSGTLIINGGTYAGSSIAYGNQNGKVYINGGNFNVTGLNGMWGMAVGQVGTFEIRGGTFTIDPSDSNYVVDGYDVVDNGDGTWTVVCTHIGTETDWDNEDNVYHSGTCERCKKAINEKHIFDENGLCTVCSHQTIVTNVQLQEAIDNGAGTEEKPIVIGGGEWYNFTQTGKEIEIYGGKFNHMTPLDNSNVTIYGGEFDFYYSFAAYATITIKDGNFTGDQFIQANDGEFTLIIEGGNFNWTSISSSANSTTITITGGTFKFNPSQYVPNTHKVVDNGDGTWTVVCKHENTVWTTTENNHSGKCSNCEKAINEPHIFVNEICSVCGYPQSDNGGQGEEDSNGAGADDVPILTK